MMKRIALFLKKETVLTIAMLLALGSMAAVPPDAQYTAYIDYQVLTMLFCLMIVVAGFQSMGLFAYLGGKLIRKTTGCRELSMALVFLCFFSSMVITNDVALLTFVPFAVLILQMTGQEERMIPVIVMQTIAANTGSMFTPIGNPQNLYLYSMTGMGMGEFLATMAPLTATAFCLLFAILLFWKNTPVTLEAGETEVFVFGKMGILYIVLFLCCMASVAKLIPYTVMLAVVCAAVLIWDRGAFKKPDYALLITFVCFFVFIGNIQRVEPVRRILVEMIQGRELATSVAASQVISNVPAAILLSGFTDQAKVLLFGTNIGGLGTLIASLASLISYKFYVHVPGSSKFAYLKCFTAWNLVFLAVLCPAAVLLL